MAWVKKQVLGKGTYGTVWLAIPRCCSNHSLVVPSIAVKSAQFRNSSSLQKEGEIMYLLSGCPEIVHCYGEDVSLEYGKKVYNLLLEYAPRGSLKDLIKRSGGRLQESDVRRYTRTILKGLSYVHEKGYVHCDIKPHNILVFPSPDGVNHLKIADFGLAKRREVGRVIYADGKMSSYRGTPLYTSPESVSCGLNEAPMDIWALGCTIVEMISGKPLWKIQDRHELLCQIAFGEELPRIPENMSEEGKDFLRRCLVREPHERWTADMLLNHPFITEEYYTVLQDANKSMASLTCPLDYDQWISQRSMFADS